MPKILFQLYIDKAQHNYIKKVSEETGRSRASIVRESIELHRQKRKEIAESANISSS